MKNANRFVLIAFSVGIYLFSLTACSGAEPAQAATPSTTPGKVAEEVDVNTPEPAADVVYGKYGCTASKYRNGGYEYIPRGFFTLEKGGRYTYNGFEKPSTGTFTVDEQGNLHFKGGYFDGGKAEKIDRPNKYFLVFPSNPDNRWTCGLVEE